MRWSEQVEAHHNALLAQLDALARTTPGPARRRAIERLDASLRADLAADEALLSPRVTASLPDLVITRERAEHASMLLALERVIMTSASPEFAAEVVILRELIRQHGESIATEVLPAIERALPPEELEAIATRRDERASAHESESAHVRRSVGKQLRV
jgi:hypothetical protein